jgi:hypothetical protein
MHEKYRHKGYRIYSLEEESKKPGNLNLTIPHKLYILYYLNRNYDHMQGFGEEPEKKGNPAKFL